MITRWKKGQSKPTTEVRKRLEKRLGIPPSAWDRVEWSQDDAPPSALGEVASPSSAAYSEPSRAPGYVSEVEGHMEFLRGLQGAPDLTTSERVRIAAEITKVLGLKGAEANRIEAIRADVEREYESLAVEEAPFVRRLIDRVLGALREYPEALSAVMEALGER